MCYETGPCRKLCCGHEFCSGCIKNWYLKGTGSGCPMCRSPIYFKGFHKIRNEWNDESRDIKCNEVLNNAFDTQLEYALEMTSVFPKKYGKAFLRDTLEDLKDIEKTFRFLRHEDLEADEIEYLLNETDFYFSDRNINKNRWIDEPIVKEHATQYPQLQRAKGSRRREGQEGAEWEMIVTFWTV